MRRHAKKANKYANPADGLRGNRAAGVREGKKKPAGRTELQTGNM
jgi:hypothetical protein